MAISIKNAEADELAWRLAEQTGRTIIDSLIVASDSAPVYTECRCRMLPLRADPLGPTSGGNMRAVVRVPQ